MGGRARGERSYGICPRIPTANMFVRGRRTRTADRIAIGSAVILAIDIVMAAVPQIVEGKIEFYMDQGLLT